MTHTDKLADLPDEMWANHIMWRLALAMGIAKHGDVVISVDPDDLLEAAVIRLGSFPNE